MEQPNRPYVRHQFADYGLVLHGTPRGVVEAKRASVDAALGQEQALQYAQNLQQVHGGSIPLIFYTNGYGIHFWESDFYPPVRSMVSRRAMTWSGWNSGERLGNRCLSN